MATLSASTLQSADEAFTTLPISQILPLERQLRKTISENHGKLRSLVGTSYRDLLGTAERIITMDVQVRQVETLMGNVGRNCNSERLGRMGKSYGALRRSRDVAEGRLGVVAQIKVLKGVVSFVGRVVRKRGDALVAAKVCVLGRLIWKSVSENGEEGRYVDILEELRRKLAGARKRLLGYISRSLVQTTGEDGEEKDVKRLGMVTTLCAYSLLTSSAPKELLRYFLQVRFEQLESKAEGNASEESLLEMLELYSQTLLDTREIFPRRFGDTLSQLSKTTLVQDVDIKAIPELSLDVYTQWIAQDVRNFHPWVRHDQLSTLEVGESLSSWGKQAQACVLQAISDALQEQTDVKTVLELRREVITKYLRLSAKLRSDSHTQAITDLRTAFLARLEELARQATRISDFDLDAQSTTNNGKSRSTWDLSTSQVSLEGGATQFRQAVIARQHGRDSATDSVITALNDWIERLQAFSEAIAAMKAAKWDDNLDLDLDDLPEETPIQDILSKQDAQALGTTLRNEATTALKNTYSRVAEASDSARDPITQIRVLREIDLHRRALSDALSSADDIRADRPFIADLHLQIAKVTVQQAVKLYGEQLRLSTPSMVGLWDGTPPLPVQPAPGTFRFLKALHRSMSDAGSDIWSREAVRAVKLFASESLSEVFANETLDGPGPRPLSNGHSPDDDDPAEERSTEVIQKEDGAVDNNDRFMQRLFDVLYLQRVLNTGKSDEDQLDRIVEQLQTRSEPDATSVERLGKSANEYWKRTYLLFGLLAAGHAS